MDKYFCICGITFKNKKQADIHENIYNSMDKYCLYHKIIKLECKDIIKNSILYSTWKTIFRLSGIYIIYFSIINHFNVKFSILESFIIGIGLGFMAIQ